VTPTTALAALTPRDVAPEYSSPYSVRFATPPETRLAGLDAWPWNDPAAQSVVAATDWYAPGTESRWGSWGPRARRYPVPALPVPGDVARERVLSVAAAMIGLDYQHHHVPAWVPPVDWPWKEVRSGRRGAGLDCSNFTGFAYSYALGIDLPTGVDAQAQTRRAATSDGGLGHRVETIRESDVDALVARLKPADIVYIAGAGGSIVHAVLWLGTCGVGPNATPLVLDCSGPGRLDSAGIPIPAGVRIRPYRRAGWYARSTAYAHRVVPD
jgi:cell wall-associated NlpC family hydrolase